VERLKENPNDMAALNQYMMESVRQILTAADSDPKAAEQALNGLKGVLDSLKPDTEPAKQALGRATSAIGYCEQQLELARTSLEECGQRLKTSPDDRKALSMFLAKVQRQLGPLTRSEPDQAEAGLKAAQEQLAAARAAAKEQAMQKQYEQADQVLAGLQKAIEVGKRLLALIGKDAAPLDVVAWVNGSPLTDADLKGKVVLLDFWAVWCGPCIATFPHLREWHEKYADKGLVIVGLTRYYGYVWDADQGRPTRFVAKPRPVQEPGSSPPAAAPDEPPAKPSPAQEQEMLQKFAEQHQLHHRLAIQKDNVLPEYYAVTGIPHVVVIDREGKIRLIRVGSGDKNAQEVEAMIASLVGESASPK
jgi:thiol-disulfide isomerase/thioredoxin